MTSAQKRAIDRIVMAMKSVPDSELPPTVTKILEILKSKQAVSEAVQKQLDKLPTQARDNLTDLAKELENSIGPPGIQLDLSTIDQKDLDILNEKPPPVRNVNDLQLDKAGNLVDADG